MARKSIEAVAEWLDFFVFPRYNRFCENGFILIMTIG